VDSHARAIDGDRIFSASRPAICSRYVSDRLAEGGPIVAFSSAGFFSSITPRGSPLRKITTSARRLCPCGPTTVKLVDRQPVVVVRIVEVDHGACAPRSTRPPVGTRPSHHRRASDARPD